MLATDVLMILVCLSFCGFLWMYKMSHIVKQIAGNILVYHSPLCLTSLLSSLSLSLYRGDIFLFSERSSELPLLYSHEEEEKDEERPSSSSSSSPSAVQR